MTPEPQTKQTSVEECLHHIHGSLNHGGYINDFGTLQDFVQLMRLVAREEIRLAALSEARPDERERERMLLAVKMMDELVHADTNRLSKGLTFSQLGLIDRYRALKA